MKKLVRLSDTPIAGVCGGIARYYHIDEDMFRCIVVVLACFTAIMPVIVLYAIATILIPHEKD